MNNLAKSRHGHCFRAAIILSISFLSLAVSARAESKTILHLSHTMGQTRAALEERFGEADVFIKKTADLSTIQWKYIEGTWIFIILKDGRSIYVTYTFKEMDPFDEDEAFAILGITPPEDSLDWEWENEAKRWKPFGQYEKLVVNPKTKAVTVGRTHPYIDAGR